ncbi:MAG: MauE/DoxX family redox-associated membrane protein [Micromonosporaceae bacterium]
MQWVSSLQPLVVAGLLAWAGVIKLLQPHGPDGARRTAVARVVGERRAPASLRAVGVVELGVAVALLLPPGHPLAAAASVLLAVCFLGYLGYAARAAPDSSCGCLSGLPATTTWRGIARAGALLAASAIGLTGTLGGFAAGPAPWWGQSLTAAPVTGTLLLIAESALFVTLSPELDRFWLAVTRTPRSPLPGRAARKVPLSATVRQLEHSEAYRELSPMIVSGPRRSWDDGDWRLVSYTVRRDARLDEVVFAVPLVEHAPELVRVAATGT